jgi:hypothetical protein
MFLYHCPNIGRFMAFVLNCSHTFSLLFSFPVFLSLHFIEPLLQFSMLYQTGLSVCHMREYSQHWTFPWFVSLSTCFFTFFHHFHLCVETKRYFLMDIMVTTKDHLVCYNYGSFHIARGTEPNPTGLSLTEHVHCLVFVFTQQLTTDPVAQHFLTSKAWSACLL